MSPLTQHDCCPYEKGGIQAQTGCRKETHEGMGNTAGGGAGDGICMQAEEKLRTVSFMVLEEASPAAPAL